MALLAHNRLLLAVTVCSVSAVEPSGELVRLHNGLPASPGANLVYFHDRLQLHPYVLAGAGWHDNPRQSGDPSSDHFLEWAVGCVGDLQAWNNFRLTFTGAGFQRHYAETAGRNLTGGSLEARGVYQGPTIAIKADGKWDRSDDPLVESGSSVERDRIDVGLGALRQGRVLRLETAIHASLTDYREDALSFDDSERDRVQGEWRLGAVRTMGDRLECGAQVTALGGHYLDSSSPYQGHVGWRAEATSRFQLMQEVRLSAIAGYEARRYDGPYQDDPAYDDQHGAGPVGSMRAEWSFAKEGRMTLAFGSRLIDSITSNVARLTEAEAIIAQQTLPRIGFSALAGWSRRVDFSGGTRPAEDADERRLGGSIIVRIRPGITSELRMLWREYDPSLSDRYDETVIALMFAVVL